MSYNNLAICSASLLIVLDKVENLDLSKALLIYPVIMHSEMLTFLSKKNTKKRKLNSLILTHPSFFINFDDRFNDSLIITLNSIQYLIASNQIIFDKKLMINREININEKFGERILLIKKASDKIIYLLDHPIEELYLNLRIKL
ncbi:three component ABC system middle component [Acinetobacter gerneri]|uniref:three component ABC system middle component n=1 Tax=Acinetobacter gerneri TaxID=202952 RepID=UPI003214ADDC